MLGYFEELAQGLSAKLATADEAVARKKLTLALARLGVELFSTKQEVAWCGVLVPFDLLRAMGVTSCFVEFVGAMLASTGNAGAFLEEAEGAGFSTDACGYHRAVTGAFRQGLMPKPSFLIATSAPCTGGLAVLESLAHGFEKELFVLNIPLGRGELQVQYLAGQLRAMAEFVASRTGRPLDEEKLRHSMALTNEARALMVEAYQLAKAVPSPLRSKDLVNFGIVMSLLLGTEQAVEIARAYRDEFKAKVQTRTGGIAHEKVRLMWLQNRVQFKNPFVKLLEESGAAVVVDELNDITWAPMDLDEPFVSMARRALSIPIVGPAEWRVSNLKRLAREYQVDGALNPCHWGCRQGTGARGLVERGLAEVGVPVLNLDVDCIDERNFAFGQLRTRLEAFLETLEKKKRTQPARA